MVLALTHPGLAYGLALMMAGCYAIGYFLGAMCVVSQP